MKTSKTLCLILLFLMCFRGAAQNRSAEEWLGDARSLGMGGALGAAFTPKADVSGTPVDSSLFRLTSVRLNLRLPYGLYGLSSQTFQMTGLSGRTKLGLILGHSGADRLFMFEVGWSPLPSLGCRFGAGLEQLGALSGVRPSQSHVVPSIGIDYRIGQQTFLGCYVFNPLPYRRGYDYYADVRIAIREQLAPQLEVICEWDKQMNRNWGTHLGGEYTLAIRQQRIRLRSGWSYPEAQYSTGAGWQGRHWQLEASWRLHGTLGSSWALTWGYVQ